MGLRRYIVTYTSMEIEAESEDEAIERADEMGGGGNWEAIDLGVAPRCACAINADGSTTTMLCPVHADTDPCLKMAQVTGRRRKGTIRRGTCTNCGHYTPSLGG